MEGCDYFMPVVGDRQGENKMRYNHRMNTKPLTFLLALTFLFCIFYVVMAEAHRSGCHRWHSCPSDSGSYICGDTGRCSACPNNQFCENGKPIVRSSESNNNNESYEPHIKGDSLNNFTPNKVIKYREADYVD